MNLQVESLEQTIEIAVLFHKTEGVGGLDRLMQTHMPESLLNDSNGREGVVLHLQQRNIEFLC